MKKVTMSQLLIAFIFFSFIQLNAQWVHTNQSYGYDVTCLAVNDTALFAGATDGVYVTYDNGQNWEGLNKGLLEREIYSLAVNDSYMFASTYRFTSNADEMIFRSANSGASWDTANIFLDQQKVKSILCRDSNVFIGTIDFTGGGKIYRSTNNGVSWQLVFSSPIYFTSLAQNDSNIFAATGGSFNHLYRSGNNGKTWALADTTFNDTTSSDTTFFYNFSVLALAVSGTRLFAATNYGIYSSNNDGLSWSAADKGLPHDRNNFSLVTSLAAGPLVNGKAELVAGTGSKGVFHSFDNGQAWEEFNTGLSDTNVRITAINSKNIYIATEGGVWTRTLSGIATAVESRPGDLPERFSLAQNYPNPFNPTTTISYSLPGQLHVELKVFDMLGREVKTLLNKEQAAGEYKISFDGAPLPSGIYIYTLQAGQFKESRKLVILK